VRFQLFSKIHRIVYKTQGKGQLDADPQASNTEWPIT